MFGFLCINKPVGMTSRRATDRVKHLIKPIKVGHSGTLDPLAAGVLVLGLGPATKLTRFVQEMPKHYVAGFRLGVSSPTDDLDGELTSLDNAPSFDIEQLRGMLPEFTGTIAQIPPTWSAVHINGQRAYRLARSGRKVDLQSREVQVHSIELTRFEFPDFELRIECGSGTYIRALGRDIGRRLKSAAVMTDLVRTRVGPFQVADAIPTETIDLPTIHQRLVPALDIFPDLPRVTLSDQQLRELRNGTIFPASAFADATEATRIAAIDSQGRLFALLARVDEYWFKPALNFCHYQSFDDS